jgi:hypothetical protein
MVDTTDYNLIILMRNLTSNSSETMKLILKLSSSHAFLILLSYLLKAQSQAKEKNGCCPLPQVRTTNLLSYQLFHPSLMTFQIKVATRVIQTVIGSLLASYHLLFISALTQYLSLSALKGTCAMISMPLRWTLTSS